MSAVALSIGMGVGSTVALGAGAYKGLEWATGNFGEDNAQAAKDAAQQQVAGANKGLGAVQDAQAGAQAGLDPYAQAGTNALQQQQALSGALGPEAQQAAVDGLQNSPFFQAQLQQGNDAILANASATGGLRGGNTQAALGQFAPQLLQQYMQAQLGNLGGLSSMGFGAAGQQGQFGMQGAGMQSGLFADRGAAQAGGILGMQGARSAGRAQAANMALSGAGTLASVATGLPVGGMVPQVGAPAAAPPVQAPNPLPGGI